LSKNAPRGGQGTGRRRPFGAGDRWNTREPNPEDWMDAALIEAVRNGARSRRSLLLKVDQWITAGNELPGRNAKAEKEIGLPAADRRELGRLRRPEKNFGGLYIC
jgi:hypothetical protein